jgi:hypothetical protein
MGTALRIMGALASVALALSVAAPGATAGKSRSSFTYTNAATSGAINLELAPRRLQNCFGSSGWLRWEVEGAYHANFAGNRMHVRWDLELTASVFPEGRETPSFAGSGRSEGNELVPIDRASDVVLVPARFRVVLRNEAHDLIAAFFDTVNVVQWGDFGITGTFGVIREYDDIPCLG